MRVVDDDEGAAHPAHDLEPALDALELAERGQHAGGRLAGGDGETGREQRVAGLVVAEQRQADVVGSGRVPRPAQALREAVAGERHELQRVSASADGQNGPAAARAAAITWAACSASALTTATPPAGSKLGEQAQLGGEIGLHARVIVEMVAAQIGEGRGLQLHAVEPVLVEPVRGGLEGEMRDAFARQLGQRLVQRDGIGRGEAAVDAAVRLDEADGAERGGLAAETGEDLAREVGHRGLAAGAGDGDDGLGLGR